MTQVSARGLTRDQVTLPAPAIPRPRRSETPSQQTGAAVDVPDRRPPGSPVRAAHVPRRRARATSVVLDVTIAASLAIFARALGAIPTDLALAVASGWPALLVAGGHYRLRSMGERRTARAQRVVEAWVRASAVALVLLPWLGVDEVAAVVQLVALVAAASAAGALAGIPRFRSRLVIVGRHRDVRDAVAELQDCDTHEVVAACVRRRHREPVSIGLPVHDGLKDIAGVASAHGADVVMVLSGTRLSAVEIRRLHWALASTGTELCLGTGLIDVVPARTRVTLSGGLSVVQVAPVALGGPSRWCKEVVERLLSLLGLLLLLPLLLAVAAAVRLDSPGPALYRQQRVGRDGRLFTMYKFRSMSTSAEAMLPALVDRNEADGVLFKVHDDPRVTRLGAWLRRWSVDEVPQLWNVLRGEMSLVGPRPALPDEVARYDVDPRRRLAVKPGCTGLWQVSGRSDLSWEQSVRLDLRYVDNWSLRLDAAILARTFTAVLTHRGAY